MLPDPWPALVLTLAAFRLARLVGWDELPPIARLREAASRGRPLVDQLLGCPFCQGFWISVAVYLAWLEAPTATLYAAAPFALSAAVGLIAKNLDP